ncbi:MAG TPA: Stp1/IreP family PP2C-type Ser/Thr phosphatase [Pyrinomonadaceae bacterium]|jgi:protein phosphatase|nr:Stp1/IreP family PP2C-type Ser/Thr phosphatase [Pyrinomonadaceae bacterium]
MYKVKAAGQDDPHQSPRAAGATETETTSGARLRIAAAVQTDVGCVREANEDAYAHVEPEDAGTRATKGTLTVVADGMGGHACGEVASRMAVEHVTRLYYQTEMAAADALKFALEEANRIVHEAALADARYYGMGTTCTALAIVGDMAVSAHIGDSRLYMLRDAELRLMTEDHSAVMEMVKLGLITPEEARHHSDKNIILRALGTMPTVEADTWDAPLALRAGDRFLICSDGLYDLVRDAEIQQTLNASAPDDACASLISLAKERGGLDNITIAIVSVESDAARDE